MLKNEQSKRWFPSVWKTENRLAVARRYEGFTFLKIIDFLQLKIDWSKICLYARKIRNNVVSASDSFLLLIILRLGTVPKKVRVSFDSKGALNWAAMKEQ